MMDKCHIIKVGKIYEDENGKLIVSDWHFDCTESNAGGLILPTDGSEGTLAGYTAEELNQISKVQVEKK